MFDVAPTELLVIALVALVVIGPKDLPRALRTVGRWVARGRGIVAQARGSMDEMMRQADLHEARAALPPGAVPAPHLQPADAAVATIERRQLIPTLGHDAA